jgi:hypothetical protein
MSLFQQSVQDKYLKNLDATAVQQAWQAFTTYFHNPAIQQNIRDSKEEEFQEGFLRELFVNVLGYTLKPHANFNLTTEYKNIKDSKKADGAIVINNEPVGVIELKGTNTTDLTKVETQAFGYKNNHPKVTYIVIANFEKLNFYIDTTLDPLTFNLFTLGFDDFKLLYLCLAYSHIEANLPKKIKEESVTQEDKITKQLYADYAAFKTALFDNIRTNNPQFDALVLYKSTQKLIDRLLFIFFAEDRNLLPPNYIRQIIADSATIKNLGVKESLYERFKINFEFLNRAVKPLHTIFLLTTAGFLRQTMCLTALL